MLHKTWIIVTLITLLGFGTRFYKIASSPEGLYIDETSIGYNAYSLLKTGRDEHGKSWPLFFEAFGEYKLPVYIYSVYLAQLILGPTDLSVRLPAVLFGTFSIPVMFLLVRELFKGDKGSKESWGKIAYLASFLLAISPWHFQFTHAGFEASGAVFFLLLGVYLFFKAIRRHSLLWLTGASMSFVLTLYTYNSARIVTPVLIGILFIVYAKKFSWRQWLGVFLFSLFLALPFIRFAISPEGLVRAQQVSIFYQNDSHILSTLLANYWKNISPVTLFIKGEPTIAHLTPHRMSLLYPIEPPFVLLGLFYFIKKHSRETTLIILWLLVGFVPPAVTTLNPHALRGVLALPALLVVSAVGFEWMIRKIRRVRVIRGIYIIVLAFLAIRFLYIYHFEYAPDAGWDWQVGIKRAALQVKSLEKNYRKVYFSEAGPGRIAYWWYLKIDPYLFLSAKDKNDLGKYQFEVHSFDQKNTVSPGLFITAENLTGVPVLEKIYYPDGSLALIIYKLH